MKIIEKPLYVHDCDDCKFLGNLDAPGLSGNLEPMDLYYCPNSPTVVARFSSHGPDYSSGLIFAIPGENGLNQLYEAKLRAIKKGFLKE